MARCTVLDRVVKKGLSEKDALEQEIEGSEGK